jgi:PAS domain S-box-containing protein
MSSHGLAIKATNPSTLGQRRSVLDKPAADTQQKECLNNQKNTQILLVEDNADHAYLTMKVLSVEGRYQVELAPSGSQAIDKLGSGEYSLILLDYRLSDMDGLQLIRKIKELHYNIPIIMTTGLGSESVAVDAMKCGVYDYLIKSGNYLDDLPVLIDKALKQYELKEIRKQWDHWMFERNQKLGVLNSIYEALGACRNSDEVLREALRIVVEALQTDYGNIRLMEKDDRVEEQFSSIPGAPKENLRSVVCIPLKSRGKVLGVMTLGSYRKAHFRGDSELLNTIGNYVGSALETAKRYEALKRQAETLRESEINYRTLVEEANDAVFIVQHGRVPYANKKTRELLGYSLEELCRIDFLDLVAPEYKDSAAKYCTAKMNGEDRPNCEVPVVRDDGQILILEINSSIIEYKNQPALQIIARHVTEERYLQWLFMDGGWV